MHTLSSAKRTCIASASAVECTATVGMPSSLQARSTRRAISPRLAIRILSNISDLCPGRSAPPKWRLTKGSLDDHKRLTEFYGLAVLKKDLNHRSRARSRNLVHRFHRFTIKSVSPTLTLL